VTFRKITKPTTLLDESAEDNECVGDTPQLFIK
jgi:hypothetical protein